jgi:hypothetical protein
VKQAIAASLRCALVAVLSIAMIGARPAMMLSHGGPAAHACGMTMASHHSSHGDHPCQTPENGACCDDCMCACAIGSDVGAPVIALVATYTQFATIIDRPDEIVRTRKPLAFRLPPQLGPPHLARS